MNTKLLEGYIGYTTYYKRPCDVIELHSGKWWKLNKKLKYPRNTVDTIYGTNYTQSESYRHSISIVEEYFK